MIFTNPYIPNHLYRDLVNEGDVIWSGFSGDPLMGSHTLDNLYIDNKQSLADFCFQKYSNLNSHELSLLNIDFFLELGKISTLVAPCSSGIGPFLSFRNLMSEAFAKEVNSC